MFYTTLHMNTPVLANQNNFIHQLCVDSNAV